MRKLIEFKLHGGQIPYFVKSVIGGVCVDGKKYGVSHDTEESYLPDTVACLTPDEFIEAVKFANLSRMPDMELMTDDEKEAYARKWLMENLS